MTGKPVVMVVEDDKNTREGLGRALQNNYEVILAESAEKALQTLGERGVDVLLGDVRMPGMDGLELLRRVKALSSPPICILLTAYGNVETAVEAMKQGAYDFLTKPVDLDHLDLLIKRALQSRRTEIELGVLRRELDERYGLENMTGTTPAMQEVFETIRRVAPTDATVLVQGESGTGKELVARALHGLSSRSKGPFIALHCAALSSSILESELFGHEKGSFTGATARRRGRFELADGGTLFLDEVSAIDPGIQAKLLRALEERRFERVGGQETIEVDIRLVAATNQNLKELVKNGKFRNDLFYRLDVVTINLPPLRERLEDVPLLCDHFVRQFAEKNARKIEGITPDAVNILSSYSWPGNVRELRNTIEKMVVLGRGNRLAARDISMNIRQAAPHAAARLQTVPAVAGGPAPGSLEESERLMIFSALEKHRGNRTKAAEELGISRRTLHRKLKEYKTECPRD